MIYWTKSHGWFAFQVTLCFHYPFLSKIDVLNYCFLTLKEGVLLTGSLSYNIEGRVCYLTMCDRSYPKKLAFQYLEDLKNEFERVNGSQIETAARPYAFIKFGMVLSLLSAVIISNWSTVEYLSFFFLQFVFFLFQKDTFIQKTKKLYQDTRTQRNITKLNDELYEVHQIMTRNVQEVLGVGEKLDRKFLIPVFTWPPYLLVVSGKFLVPLLAPPYWSFKYLWCY